MFAKPQTPFELKAKMLCEGVNPDSSVVEMFLQQNPSNVKRGGLSSGGKMELDGHLFVNAPFYRKWQVDLHLTADPMLSNGVVVMQDGDEVGRGRVLSAPSWYGEMVDGFPITQILTAHNRQLAASVYEDCALFAAGTQCEFCVIRYSLAQRDPRLVKKSGSLFLKALERIPADAYGGLTINGGLTFSRGRGMEIFVPVVTAIRKQYPDLPIAVEITPPTDRKWIDRLADAGVSSLMMNLECWDADVRRRTIPGKDAICPRGMYLYAFDRAVEVFGAGRVSTCFVVGTEPEESLREGIREVVRHGVIPSMLAGRTFEDVAGYPFSKTADTQMFLDVVRFSAQVMKDFGISTTDKAGCVACGMCDIIRDCID
ncbi:MAG: radical SAM protein [Patescibacteria group bacterium]|jgi:biotin synthase-related radical SAM superfamily protein